MTPTPTRPSLAALLRTIVAGDRAGRVGAWGERLRQTYRHLAVPPDDEIAGSLTEDQRRAIAGLSRADRRHALRTFAKLRAAGADEELCFVGLVQDFGKPPRARLWHRVAAVLAPRLARRVGGATMRGYLGHAARGAELARTAGLSERAVRLIARHHERPRDDDERLLARADREDA